MAKQDHTINRDEPSERAVERKRLTGDIQTHVRIRTNATNAIAAARSTMMESTSAPV